MKLVVTNEDLNHNGEPLPLLKLRAAAYFLLHVAGDLNEKGEVSVPTGTIATPPPPPVAVTAPAVNTAVASVAANTSMIPPPPVTAPVPVSNVPPPPPPPANIVPPPPPANMEGVASDDNGDDEGDAPSNVVQGNFPQAGSVPPPPPTSNGTGANTAGVPLPPTSSGAVTAEGAVIVASAEVDKFGMPYDARIHQKAKGVMKNGGWKLIKGIDQAIVQAVTAELAAKRGSLPPTGNTVPVPPSPPTPPAPPVPTQNGVGQSVPVPPAPPVGPLGAGDAYRNFVDKVIALNRDGKVSSAKVNELCQLHGASNIMTLASMPHLVADVERAVDAAALGLM